MPVSYDTIANIQMDRGTTSLGDLGLPPLITLHKKWSFPLKISSVNMSKSTENCGFRHIYRRNHKQKLHFLYSVKQGKMALVLLTFCCEFTGKIERYSPNRFLRLSHHKSKK